jgi:hypothetical protein
MEMETKEKIMKKRTILLPLLVLATIGSTMLSARGHKGQQETQRTHKTKKAQDAGWYMRTRISVTAEDGTVYTHNTAGVFGKLKQSKYKKDRHDIPAFGAATLQVVFPHYNWKEGDAGDYWSDYRRYKKRRANKRAVWTFQVKNQKGVDLSNADLKIELDDARIIKFTRENGSMNYVEAGVNTKKKNKFTLVDVDNKQTYKVDELEYANLSMDGKHTRTFRWVRGNVKRKDFKPVVMPKE